MKRKLAYIIIMSALVCFPASAAKKNIRSIGRDRYTITAGNLTMTVDAREGARVTSLKYLNNEILSQEKGPNAHGSTFWTSPQKDWNWPPVKEHDSDEYKVEKTKKSLILTSKLSQRFPFRIIKEFSTDKKNRFFVMNYTIINETNEEHQIAPWEITRVPSGGVVFFDAPAKAITTNDDLKFKQRYGVSWYEFESNRKYRKANIDAKGWIAYANNGILFIKQSTDLNPSQPAPGEAEIQLYVHNGKTYMELENQGEYVSLKPGESCTLTVKWFVLPLDVEAEPSRELVQRVKSIIK